MVDHIDIAAGCTADIPALSRALAIAFQEDPVMAWVLPDEAARAEKLPTLFAAMTRYHHLAGGGVEVARFSHGKIRAAALWDPPGRWKHTVVDQLRAMPTLLRAFGRQLSVAGHESGSGYAAGPP